MNRSSSTAGSGASAPRWRSRWLGCLLLVGLGCTVGSSHATLVEVSNAQGHVVHDSVTGGDWVWDLSAFNLMTLGEQLQSIADNYAGTAYFGQTRWHMASFAESQALFARYSAREIEVFNRTYTGFHDDGTPQVHWFGRWVGQDTVMGINGVMDDAAFWPGDSAQYMGNTLTDASGRFGNVGAWVTTVPEPANAWLLLAGLPLLVAACRPRRRVARST